jgi:hypothetical protein
MSNISFNLLSDLEKFYVNNNLYKKLNKELYELNKVVIVNNRSKIMEYKKRNGTYNPNYDSNNKNNYKKNNYSKQPINSLKSKMLFNDKYEMIFNRECNKLTEKNILEQSEIIIDTLTSFINDKIVDYLDNYIKLKIRLNNNSINFEDFNYNKLNSQYDEYQNKLWLTVIKKMIMNKQNNNVYYQLLNTLISYENELFINKLNICFDNILDNYRNIYKETKFVNSDITYFQIFSDKLNELKNIIINENYKLDTLLENKNKLFKTILNYINDDNILNLEYIESLNKMCSLKIDLNIENNYKVFGEYIKYIYNTSDNTNDLTIELQTKIYKNFMNISELFNWEPLNMDELEKRIYFIIGFLTDNKLFVRNIGSDVFNKYESLLDSIKNNKIPPIIKYKVFDIIDNFKDLRKK